MVTTRGALRNTDARAPYPEISFNWDGAQDQHFSKLLTTGPLGNLLLPSDSSMSQGRTAAFLRCYFSTMDSSPNAIRLSRVMYVGECVLRREVELRGT